MYIEPLAKALKDALLTLSQRKRPAPSNTQRTGETKATRN